MAASRQYLTLHGENTHEPSWMLDAGLLALGGFFSREMFSLCLLHQKMNMKLKFNLHLKGAYLQYQLWWALRGCHFRAGSLTLSTVHAVEFLGMLKVPSISVQISMFWHFYSGSALLTFNFCAQGGTLLLELNRMLRPWIQIGLNLNCLWLTNVIFWEFIFQVCALAVMHAQGARQWGWERFPMASGMASSPPGNSILVKQIPEGNLWETYSWWFCSRLWTLAKGCEQVVPQWIRHQLVQCEKRYGHESCLWRVNHQH